MFFHSINRRGRRSCDVIVTLTLSFKVQLIQVPIWNVKLCLQCLPSVYTVYRQLTLFNVTVYSVYTDRPPPQYRLYRSTSQFRRSLSLWRMTKFDRTSKAWPLVSLVLLTLSSCSVVLSTDAGKIESRSRWNALLLKFFAVVAIWLIRCLHFLMRRLL